MCDYKEDVWMSAKPLIGINGDFRAEGKQSVPLSWYNTGYYDSVSAAGGLPVLVPPLVEDADLKQFLKLLDGLVLVGCSFDLDSVRMGLDHHPATRSMASRREDFDRRLCTAAVALKMPILAIGVGMQTLNVVCGGSLFQHIDEEVPKSLLHRDPVEKGLRHSLDIVPGTRVDAMYGPGEIRVNSQHHMAVAELADAFQVSATRCGQRDAGGVANEAEGRLKS